MGGNTHGNMAGYCSSFLFIYFIKILLFNRIFCLQQIPTCPKITQSQTQVSKGPDTLTLMFSLGI